MYIVLTFFFFGAEVKTGNRQGPISEATKIIVILDLVFLFATL